MLSNTLTGKHEEGAKISLGSSSKRIVTAPKRPRRLQKRGAANPTIWSSQAIKSSVPQSNATKALMEIKNGLQNFSGECELFRHALLFWFPYAKCTLVILLFIGCRRALFWYFGLRPHISRYSLFRRHQLPLVSIVFQSYNNCAPKVMIPPVIVAALLFPCENGASHKSSEDKKAELEYTSIQDEFQNKFRFGMLLFCPHAQARTNYTLLGTIQKSQCRLEAR